jgi:hypothetical protein
VKRIEKFCGKIQDVDKDSIPTESIEKKVCHKN